VDALQQLESVLPEVILLDIEMPRMDGFELSRAVRGNPRTAHIPLIVISSRTADKHRKYAEELGVNVYLGKPYQEEELLAHITGLTSG
jgi:chemosensory pili system protein ChpA (sensor histidine kinase/response regulator)